MHRSISNYNADQAVVSDVSSVTAADVEGFNPYVSGTMPEGLVYKGGALILESETMVRQYFNVENGHNISEYSFYTDGNPVYPEYKDAYRMYYIDVKNVPSELLYKNTELTVQNGVDYATIYYSPYSYVRGKLNSSSDESLKNLCKALYIYGQAAEEYFSNNGVEQ